jgi:transcriptional regulator with XRE-family HTH domain
VGTHKNKLAQNSWLRTVGANIRRVRVVRGVTQEGLAELADLAPRTIQKIEAGQITILITTLWRLQLALGCPYEVLLKEEAC